MSVIVLLLAASINFSTAISSIAVALGVLLLIGKTFYIKTLPPINQNYIKIFGVYFLCQFLIAMLSTEPPISFREFAGEFHRVLPFFLAILFIKNKFQLRNVLAVILFCNIINDCCACYQKFFLLTDYPPAFNKSPEIFDSFLIMQLPIQIFMITLPIIPTWCKRLSIFACGLTIFSIIFLSQLPTNFLQPNFPQFATDIFLNNPVHGIGQRMLADNPQNIFLNEAAEGGLLGIFAFVILHGFFITEFYRLFRQDKTKKFPAGLVALIILILLLAEGLSDTNMNQIAIMREYWLTVGLMIAAHNLGDKI